MRIKVTGYIETEDNELYDENHHSGLSDMGYRLYTALLSRLDDIDFELED